MPVTRDAAHGVGLYVDMGKITAFSVAVRGTATAASSASVVVEGPINYADGLVNDPKFSASIPNQFYGVAEYDSIDIELANLDGQFSHLLVDDEREAFVRLRRYDPALQAIRTVAVGIIDSFKVGDSVTLQVMPHNFAKLADPFPRVLVSTVEFPNATDVGAPIPVFFGEGRDSQCPYVAFNDVVQTYDYLVGEGPLDVFAVKKNGIPAFVQPLDIITVQASTFAPTNSRRVQFVLGGNTPHAPCTYQGFYVKGLVGGIRDRVFKITRHLTPPENATRPPGTYARATYSGVPGISGTLRRVTFRAAWRGQISPGLPVATSMGSANFTGVNPWVINVAETINQVSIIIAFSNLPVSWTGGWSLIYSQRAPTVPATATGTLSIFARRATSSTTTTFTLTLESISTGRMYALKFSNCRAADDLAYKSAETSARVWEGGIQRPMPDYVEFNGTPIPAISAGLLMVDAMVLTTVPTGAYPTVLFDVYDPGSNGAVFMMVAAVGFENQQKSIVEIDEYLSPAEVAAIPRGVPAIQIQEYDELIQTPTYPDRTVIRFGRRQVDAQGSPYQIAASARRLLTPRINILLASEDLDDAATWERDSFTSLTTFKFTGAPITAGTNIALVGPNGFTDGNTFFLQARLGGAGWALSQVITSGFEPTQYTYTLSFWWFDKPGTHNLDITLEWRGGFDTDEVSNTLTGTGTQGWKFYSHTFTPTFSFSNPLEMIAVSFADINTFQFGFVQLEAGSAFTTYEQTARKRRDLPPGTPAWTAPDAIGAILSNPRWGLGDPIDDESFQTAARALLPAPGSTASLRPWQIAVSGVLPGPHGEQPTTKEVLDELARTCGAILRRDGEAWTIQVDTATAAISGVFGAEETPYKNLKDVEVAERPSITESVKQLRVLYDPRLGLFSEKAEPFFAGGLDRTVGDHGVLQETTFKLIRAAETADRVSAYNAAYVPALENPITAKTGIEGAFLRPGGLIKLYEPRLQLQNLVASSEREVSPDGWTETFTGSTSAPTITRRAALGPFGTTYAATKVLFPAIGGAPGLSKTATSSPVSNPQIMLKAIGSLWLRAPAGATIAAGVRIDLDTGAGGSVTSLFVTPSRSWTKYTFTRALNTAEATATCGLGLARSGTSLPACEVLMWGAQLALDWERPYIKTDGAVVDPTYVYKLTSVAVDQQSTEFTAIPYDAAVLFAPYTPGTVFMPRIPDDLTVSAVDAVPDEITDLQMPPVTGWGSDSAGGAVVYWAELRFLMPPRGAIGVIVQIQKVGELGWTDVATVRQAGGTLARAIARGLMPDTAYYVRVVSFDVNGNFRGTDNVRQFDFPEA